jgi:hypothetical protein
MAEKQAKARATTQHSTFKPNKDQKNMTRPRGKVNKVKLQLQEGEVRLPRAPTIRGVDAKPSSAWFSLEATA